jgi:hypothetical protein
MFMMAAHFTDQSSKFKDQKHSQALAWQESSFRPELESSWIESKMWADGNPTSALTRELD